MPNELIAIAVIAATAVAMFLAAARELPWSGGFELRGVFGQIQGMTTGTPVRIAGVDVGEVTETEPLGGDGAGGKVLVTMELDEQALPIHDDATLRLRPRLFLEGNYFIDLRPGSPVAPEVDAGHTIALGSTSSPVQLDQVLTTLQSDTRSKLRIAIDQLGNALERHGGARGLRSFARASAGAYRSTALVSQALLGTERHDLSGLIANLGRVVAALDRNERGLQSLVVNLEVVGGALAAEAAALERTVAGLPETIETAQPVLAELSASLPGVRAFAREALPGIEALPPAVDAATPLLAQLGGLVSERELRGVAADLRPTVPELVRLTRSSLPLLSELRSLSSCFNEVVIPWAYSTVPDPETPATGRIFEETSYGLVGIAGESRSLDGNGPYARVLGGTGGNLVALPPFEGETDQIYGVSPLPILGARPAIDSSARTPLRTDIACETQEPPDLDSGDDAELADQSPMSEPSLDPSPALRARLARIAARLDQARGQADALKDLNALLARALGWPQRLGLAAREGR